MTHFEDAAHHRVRPGHHSAGGSEEDFWHHDHRDRSGDWLCPVTQFVLNEEASGFPELGNEIAFEVP